MNNPAMNIRIRVFSFLILACIVLAAAGCDTGSPTDDSLNGTFAGPAQALGDGSAYTTVTFADDVPTAMRVVLTEAALEGLPDQVPHGAAETVLALPAEAAGVAPYDHVSLDWNPNGHEPPGVYDIPHFDVHFYFLTQAERDAIALDDPEFEAKSGRRPAEQYIPAGYVPTPGAVPRMGAHWVNPQSPEFSPAGFSQTFIYGFWDSQMVFLEPMVTRDFLLSLQEGDPVVTLPVPQPETYQRSGHYPSEYSVEYDDDAGTYAIALEGLTQW